MSKQIEEKGGKESKYAKKKAAGNQMYGPGCCGNKLTPEQMASMRRRLGTEGPGSRS